MSEEQFEEIRKLIDILFENVIMMYTVRTDLSEV